MSARLLIKEFEGLRQTPYLCPAGVWTVGWGHTKHAALFQELKFVLTLGQCELLLDEDIDNAISEVDRIVRVHISPKQRDALVSFMFNFGSTKVEKSTLLRKLNESDYKGAAGEFLKWIYATEKGQLKALDGLLRRRNAERKLFLEGTNV